MPDTTAKHSPDCAKIAMRKSGDTWGYACTCGVEPCKPAPLPGEVEPIKTWDCVFEWEEQGGHVCPVVYMRSVVLGEVGEPYVLYSDHEAAVRALAEKNAELRGEVERLKKEAGK